MRMRHVATFKNLHNLHASDWWNKELSVISFSTEWSWKGKIIKRIEMALHFQWKINLIGINILKFFILHDTLNLKYQRTFCHDSLHNSIHLLCSVLIFSISHTWSAAMFLKRIKVFLHIYEYNSIPDRFTICDIVAQWAWRNQCKFAKIYK